METGHAIREAVKKMSHQPVTQVVAATVNSVDWTNRTCEVTCDDDTILEGVRLRAVIDDSDNKPGWCFKPAVNSYVLVALVNNQPESAYVAMFTNIDSLEVNYNDTPVLVIDMTQGQITANNGNNDGLVNIKPLVTKLNNLENLVNNILNALKGCSIVLAPSGNFPLLPFFTAYNDLVDTVQADLEDTNFKH